MIYGLMPLMLRGIGDIHFNDVPVDTDPTRHRSNHMIPNHACCHASNHSSFERDCFLSGHRADRAKIAAVPEADTSTHGRRSSRAADFFQRRFLSKEISFKGDFGAADGERQMRFSIRGIVYGRADFSVCLSSLATFSRRWARQARC